MSRITLTMSHCLMICLAILSRCPTMKYKFTCKHLRTHAARRWRTHAGGSRHKVIMTWRARWEPSHSSDVELALAVVNALELQEATRVLRKRQSAPRGPGSIRPRAMGCAQTCAMAQWSPCTQARSPQHAARTRPWSPSVSDTSRWRQGASTTLSGLSQVTEICKLQQVEICKLVFDLF